MIRPEDYEQDEQQKLDKARGGDESFEEDSDYFSFERSQDRVLGSEYGSEISKGDRMDDTGTYKFDTGDATNLEEIFKRRRKIYTYFDLKDIISGMEPDGVFPHLEDFERAKLMDNVYSRRGVGNVLLGLDFKKDNTKTLFRLINRKVDPKTNKLTGGFEFAKHGQSENIKKNIYG